jgi:hypothetical protein
MAKWVNSSVLDNGLNQIKSATQMRLISAYAAGDSWATVNTNTLAQASMTGTDYTNGNGASNARTLTTAAGKSATASASAASPDLHIAFTDGSVVYWVTDETSNQAITSGNTVNFPSVVYTSNQPT